MWAPNVSYYYRIGVTLWDCTKKNKLNTEHFLSRSGLAARDVSRQLSVHKTYILRIHVDADNV